MNFRTASTVGVAALSLLLSGCEQDNWSLRVCKTKLNNAECQDNSYVIDGFATKKECMLEGVTRFSKEGFECGNNCEELVPGGVQVCSEICNGAGCSK